MPLKMSEGSFEEVHQFMSVVFAAYSDPYEPFVAMIFPGLSSDSPEKYENARHDAAERVLKDWKARPSERWVKVVDTEIGKIVR
jgi:hypothetical protein